MSGAGKLYSRQDFRIIDVSGYLFGDLRGKLMRILLLLLIFITLSQPAIAGETGFTEEAAPPQPVQFEFGGYKFGQSPAANMVCFAGFCKSQAPGGDGVFTYPFSVYETPGAVSTQIGVNVVSVRYTFWNDQLYRIGFRVDCAPQPTEECVDDLIRSLDREYDLTPLSQNDWRHFVSGKRSIIREFVSDSGAIFRLRVSSSDNEWNQPYVDIVDKSMADQVGSTLSPNYRPKKLLLPEKSEH